MAAFRKIVDSSSLAGIFDLPPVFMNRKIEVIMFPIEDTAEVMPKFTMAQIEEAANSPKVQAIVGVLGLSQGGVGLFISASTITDIYSY